jgi:adenylate cyclase
MRNIEIKARLKNPRVAQETAATLATTTIGQQHQIDTYFHARHGRLKLREIDGLTAQLISYSRPDEQGPKASDYLLVPVADPKALKAALASALGVRVIVDKRREIFLVDNVRIHLDNVAGLGWFLEFEAVLSPKIDDAKGRSQLDDLMHRFEIGPDDLVPGSYADLLTAG